MFALGQNWAEIKHDYYAEVFPSASIFKGRKWQKITNIARKKLCWPKLEIPKGRRKA